MRVEPGEGGGGRDRPADPAPGGGRRVEGRGAYGAAQRQQPVGREERDPAPAQNVDDRRREGHQRADPGDAGDDQHRVGRRAHRHDRADVSSQQALAQHEGVLRADRDDEAERGEETCRGGDGGRGRVHGADARQRAA
ncbi:hypothetical protein QE405_003046 [Nocardioides zeae]|uniref:Uncharacterized protein n=1 Tax=Nocardioides zeae TaxID=1457234 RepID=A0AAJ1U920_9ACTN|nr:hypothetical protein [Nocardioides zeae]